jgi:hypothetical protein
VNLAARFRAALRRRRPVVVAPAGALPAPRRLLALPAPPPRRSAPIPEHPVCPHCRERHPPTLPAPSAWSTSLLPDLGRPALLGRGRVHDEALVRDRFGGQVWGWRP